MGGSERKQYMCATNLSSVMNWMCGVESVKEREGEGEREREREIYTHRQRKGEIYKYIEIDR